MTTRALWLACSAVLWATACTQKDDNSGSPVPTGGTGGTTTTSLGGGGSGATGAGGSGATGGTSTGGAGGTSPGGGGGTGGGATGGTGGAPESPAVECDGLPCEVSGNGVCCLAPNGPNTSCEPSGTCGESFIVVHCDGPEDCAGEDCCAIFDFGPSEFTDLECSSNCNTWGRMVVCNNDQTVCPSGMHCNGSGHLPNPYKICN